MYTKTMTNKFDELVKAITRLKEALAQPKDEFLRDSVIQRYEFCIELAWKSAKKAMGTSTSSPKDIVREMGQSEYIQDTSIWLQAIDMRNLSTHTYKEDLAEQVYGFAKKFVPELEKLIVKLEDK